jgi:UDP-glucose 4-epimerase
MIGTTKQTTVLVTGGFGFIGSHLVEALVKQGYKIRILDNLSTGSRDNLAVVSSQDIDLLNDWAKVATISLAAAIREYLS